MEEHNKQRLIIKLLHQLSEQDAQVSDFELQFIAHVQKIFGWDINELNQVGNLEVPLELSKTEQERMNVIYYLLFMLNSDGNIDDREIRFIKKVGFMLGFRSRLIEDMLACITENPEEKIAPEKLIDKIRKYMN